MKNKEKIFDETTQVTSEIRKVIKKLSKKRTPPNFDFNLRLGSDGVKKLKEYLDEK